MAERVEYGNYDSAIYFTIKIKIYHTTISTSYFTANMTDKKVSSVATDDKIHDIHVVTPQVTTDIDKVTGDTKRMATGASTQEG